MIKIQILEKQEVSYLLKMIIGYKEDVDKVSQ